MQQAPARLRLRRAGRLQPQPRRPRHQRAVHRHAPVRHVRGAGGAGRGDSSLGPEGRRARFPSASSTVCTATPGEARRCCKHGELITAVELPARRRSPAVALPEGARPAALRVRAGVGGGGAGSQGRHDHRRRAWRWAAWRTSRGARRGGEGILVGAQPGEPTFRRAAEAATARRAAAQAQRASRSSWQARHRAAR